MLNDALNLRSKPYHMSEDPSILGSLRNSQSGVVCQELHLVLGGYVLTTW